MDKPKPAENSGEAAAKKKVRGRPFAPGVSGNPGGRPKTVREVQDLASTYTEEAILMLVSIMRESGSDKERRMAAESILNRACGMPSQPLTGREGAPLEGEFPVLLEALKKLTGET